MGKTCTTANTLGKILDKLIKVIVAAYCWTMALPPVGKIKTNCNKELNLDN